MRKLLALNKEGQLCLRSHNGVESEIQKPRRSALLLVDTSGSMAGSKIEQAKSGAIDFVHSATSKGYTTALAIFADRAAMVCDPTVNLTHFTSNIARLDVGVVGGSTNLAAGLELAQNFLELGAVVVVTDGQTNDNTAALKAAIPLKDRGVDIICIGTDDADRDFLKVLATRCDLAVRVQSRELHSAITSASRLLRGA